MNNTVSVRELGIPTKALQAFQKGADLLAKKDAAASLPHFQRAVAEFASFYEAYYRMGVADLKLWRLTDAEQAYRKSIELSAGQYAQPLLALGILLSYQEKYAEAEGVTRKGLDLDPTSWAGHYALGCSLFGLNRLEEAEKSIREALHWNTDSADSSE
jgi:tetratricopeptide (TPR) repeat protein